MQLLKQRFLPADKATRGAFIQYFKMGMSIAELYNYHQTLLEYIEDICEDDYASGCTNSTERTVCY